MTKFLQTVSYIASLLFVLFIGSFFHVAFWQAKFHAHHLLGGRPLPILFAFLIIHYGIMHFLFLFPWLGFAGLPFLARTEMRWDTNLFILRFIAFALVEFFMLTFFTFFLFVPFISYYAVLENHDWTWVEFLVAGIFWFCVLLFPATFLVRFVKRRKTSSTIPIR